MNLCWDCLCCVVVVDGERIGRGKETAVRGSCGLWIDDSARGLTRRTGTVDTDSVVGRAGHATEFQAVVLWDRI